MSQSARLGTTPLTPRDTAIRRGLLLLSPSTLNPNPSLPFGPPQPAGFEFETWAPSLQIGSAFAIFLVLAFTCARLWIRGYYIRKVGVDDYLMVPATLGVSLYLAANFIQTSQGCLGQHMWDCTYESFNHFFFWVQIDTPLFYFSAFTAKLSIAFQNRRMTYLAGTKWGIVHWTFIALFSILLPILTFINAFVCKPTTSNYDLASLGSLPNPREVVCLNRNAVSLGSRSLHIITDVALLCVPIIIVFRLHMPVSKKIRLSAIFAVGGMSTIAGIIRNVNFVKDDEDFTWASHPIFIFNLIDVTFAIIVANLPALNVIVDPTWEYIRSTVGYTSRDHPEGSFRASQNLFLAGRRSRRNPPTGESVLVTGEDAQVSRGPFVELTNSKASKSALATNISSEP